MKKNLIVVFAVIAICFVFVACDNSSSTPVDTLAGVKGSLDPSKPYDAYHYGLFDNQKCTYSTTWRNGDTKYDVGNTTVTYSAYIPKDFQVKSSLYIVLIPNNTTASEFARSEIGMEWINLARTDNDPFAVVFVEPQDGKEWNTAEDPDGRDEAAAAYAVFSSARNKSSAENAFISVDKSGVRLVGYEEGATAASIWASAWPQLFANTTLINPEYKETIINNWLDKVIYPFAIDSSSGYDLGMTAREVAMPMFLYGDNETVNSFEELYSTINENCSNPDTSRDKTLEKVEVLPNSTVEVIYEKAKENNRFLGYPGGTIRGVFGAYDGTGFSFVKEDNSIDGYTRRWLVYVPDSYDETKKTPLVVALHGSSASVTDLPEESRWTDVADKNGFIVVFIQGYPAGTPNPIPSWFSLSGGVDTDVQYIKKVVEKVQAQYNIDSSRMYLTGHSLGSMMTQMFASSSERELFAAYGPVGAALSKENINLYYSSNKLEENVSPLPMWFFKGEFDLNGNNIDGTTGGDTAALQSWVEVNEIDDFTLPNPVDENETISELPNGKYLTYSFANEDDIPLVKYTQVSASPHTYMVEEAELLWTWFENWSRADKGTCKYNGTIVSLY